MLSPGCERLDAGSVGEVTGEATTSRQLLERPPALASAPVLERAGPLALIASQLSSPFCRLTSSSGGKMDEQSGDAAAPSSRPTLRLAHAGMSSGRVRRAAALEPTAHVAPNAARTGLMDAALIGAAQRSDTAVGSSRPGDESSGGEDGGGGPATAARFFRVEEEEPVGDVGEVGEAGEVDETGEAGHAGETPGAVALVKAAMSSASTSREQSAAHRPSSSCEGVELLDDDDTE